MPKLRLIVFLSLTCAHGAFVGLGSQLSENLAPVAAGTIYLPLWPLNRVGISVFGRAESGGWPGPSFLGWLCVIAFWSALWWLLATAIAKVHFSSIFVRD